MVKKYLQSWANYVISYRKFVCNYLIWGDETKCECESKDFPKEHIKSPHQRKGKMRHPEGVQI